MSPRHKATTSRYSTRDKLIAAGASAAVVVATMLLIVILKPGDSGPSVTPIPSSIPELQGDPSGGDPNLTVPSLPVPEGDGSTPSVPPDSGPSAPPSSEPTGPPAS